ncbi:Type II secretion system protein G precursor [Gemmata obscuriglobus]|uniref:Prepilin-type cleavage/methylation domain-containing protein n=1 Tax=Gemmata obscuriglobus TaxID=114 RepID=A0A2Z3HJU1_9BACT|nr:prepilin-type cleavage/methylation domain-containing protein [Gemmata obscuriglobus]QEG32331.1 Type II secretion system protein G precursor [Gemmata obscuriglobus]VTS11687.1 hypothetical protein : General secretion pathway protein G OS=Verminephrobacter eiseniae (strain EF01-2) GN=Veis_0686 PE=4 SV=1: N_methyl_2: T2SG [Gemmata obscuriglobus UQM 2246]
MLLTTTRRPSPARRREAFTLIEVLVVVAILVILATIAAVAVPKQMMEAKKGTAITGCATISKAVDLYSTSVSNPGTSDDERLPQNLEALANPGWSSSFLPDGERSLIDPWGNRYQAMNAVKDDGITPYILVYTTAPDGTKISQFGAGAKSRVNQ